MKNIVGGYQIGIFEEIPKRLQESVIPMEVWEKDSSDIYVGDTSYKRNFVLGRIVKELLFDLQMIEAFQLLVYSSRIVLVETGGGSEQSWVMSMKILNVFEIPGPLILENIDVEPQEMGEYRYSTYTERFKKRFFT